MPLCPVGIVVPQAKHAAARPTSVSQMRTALEDKLRPGWAAAIAMSSSAGARKAADGLLHRRADSLAPSGGTFAPDPAAAPFVPAWGRNRAFGHLSTYSVALHRHDHGLNPATEMPALLAPPQRTLNAILAGPPARRADMTKAVPEDRDHKNEESQVHGVRQNSEVLEGKPRTARSMSIKELSAGFGFDIDSDADFRHPLHGALGSSLGSRSSTDKANPGVPGQRVAVEGRTGHGSEPSTAMPHYDPAQGHDDALATEQAYLRVNHEPRQSLSAPDLQHLLQKLGLLGNGSHPLPAHEADEDAGSEDESDRSAEYSNPSDEERARERRDLATAKAGQSSPARPARMLAGKVGQDLVMAHRSVATDTSDQEDIISNPSDEDRLAIGRATQIGGSSRDRHVPVLLHQSGPFSAANSINQRVPANGTFSMNANAPEFVLPSKRSHAIPIVAPPQAIGEAQTRAGPLASTAASLNAAALEFKPQNNASMGTAANLTIGPSRDDSTSERTLSGLPEIQTSNVSTPPGVDNMRGFKFPPSPRLHPISPDNVVSPLPMHSQLSSESARKVSGPPDLRARSLPAPKTLPNSLLDQFTIVSPIKDGGFLGEKEFISSGSKPNSAPPDVMIMGGSPLEAPQTPAEALRSVDTTLVTDHALLHPAPVQAILSSDVSMSEFGSRNVSPEAKVSLRTVNVTAVLLVA